MRAAVAVVAGLFTALALVVPASGASTSTPNDDRVLPIDQYTSDKARTLATAHSRALRELNAEIYHCLPWLEVEKHSIGFFRPKKAPQDDRYLSLRVFIEQDPSPEFAALRMEERASAMFSRYTGPLLRRMTRDQAVASDARIDGFTVILEWLKHVPRTERARPVHETIAIFMDRPTAADYLAGRARTRDLAARARVLGFDGETALGQLQLAAWDDNFVATYKVANYELARGVTCR